jgi:hypothetical protein
MEGGDMGERIIPPYVKDEEHNAPRHLRVQAYPHFIANSVDEMRRKRVKKGMENEFDSE